MDIRPHLTISPIMYLYKNNIMVMYEVECLGIQKIFPAFLVFCGDLQVPVLIQKIFRLQLFFPSKNLITVRYWPLLYFLLESFLYITRLDQNGKEKECAWSDSYLLHSGAADSRAEAQRRGSFLRLLPLVMYVLLFFCLNLTCAGANCFSKFLLITEILQLRATLLLRAYSQSENRE